MKIWKFVSLAAIILVLFFILKNLDKEQEAELVSTQPIDSLKVDVIATGLDTPWEIVFLPSGEMVVAERSGKLSVLGDNPREIKIPGVIEAGEGGHLGVALHPNFGQNKYIYIYYTTSKSEKIINRVIRFTFENATITNPQIIIDDIPGARNHNGGRIAFGPDKLLYITTGDAENENTAQDINSLAGKILRIKDDGSIPEDNPFNNAIYSYGHRNPQGLAWDDNGGLWSTEHGRSGFRTGLDELNYIQKGGNYGWPVIEGDEAKDGMIQPVVHSGPDTTWAPAGIAYMKGKLYFAGLRGQTLYEVSITSPGKIGRVIKRFEKEYGRLRAVTTDRAGVLYVSTSNRDGRGNAGEDDDLIFKVR